MSDIEKHLFGVQRSIVRSLKDKLEADGHSVEIHIKKDNEASWHGSVAYVKTVNGIDVGMRFLLEETGSWSRKRYTGKMRMYLSNLYSDREKMFRMLKDETFKEKEIVEYMVTYAEQKQAQNDFRDECNKIDTYNNELRKKAAEEFKVSEYHIENGSEAGTIRYDQKVNMTYEQFGRFMQFLRDEGIEP